MAVANIMIAGQSHARTREPITHKGGARRRFPAPLAVLANASAVFVLLMMAALLAVLFYAALPSLHTFGAVSRQECLAAK